VTGPREPLAALPLSLGDWRGRDEGPLDARVLEILGADEYLIRGYLRPGGPFLSLYVGYYKTQRQGQTIHSPLNCLPGAGWEPISRGRVTLPAEADDPGGGRSAEINRLIIQKGIDRQLVLYWYQAHGRIVASEYWGKIYTVVDAIRLNRSDGSMVRVIVPIASANSGAEQAAERAALEFVRTLLPALSKRLDG
jgi:EpsI family protein